MGWVVCFKPLLVRTVFPLACTLISLCKPSRGWARFPNEYPHGFSSNEICHTRSDKPFWCISTHCCHLWHHLFEFAILCCFLFLYTFPGRNGEGGNWLNVTRCSLLRYDKASMDVYSYVLTVLIKLFMCISRITAILLAATYSGYCTSSNQQYFVFLGVSAIEF